METPGAHLPIELITDLAEARVTPTPEVRAHLEACARCAEDLAWLERVINHMREGADFEEPPEAAVKEVKALFRRRATGSSLGQRIVAAILGFDSARAAPAFGLRAGGGLERQMIYHAAGYDLDLRISPAGGRWAVSGQVLSETLAGPGSVELVGAGDLTRAELGPLSEFTLNPMPAGSYHLTVRIGDLVVVIPGLELGF